MEQLRLARAEDAQGLLAIYGPIVESTAISFETEVPSVQEMQERVANTLRDFPWLVFELDGQIAGYAYASRHRQRAAYQWSVDVSVYVATSARRRGLGRRLYAPLLGIVRTLGYCTAYAGIALPNAASVALHESMGFVPVGVFRNVGYKLGEWQDVGWWQRPLRDYAGAPIPPRSMSELVGTEALAQILGQSSQVSEKSGTPKSRSQPT